MTQQEQTQKEKKLKVVIIILAVLLVLSAGVLAARYIYREFIAPTQSTATVPDNLIGDDSNQSEGNNTSGGNTESSNPVGNNGNSENSGNTETTTPVEAKVLELYQGKPGDNEKFEVKNMFPGDMITKYFCVRVNHEKDIELFFKTDITEQIKELGNVLNIKVTHLESGNVLCDAPFNEVNGKEFAEMLTVNEEKVTTAYYQIDVSLDTSVGNEYQAALLKADFNWFVKDDGKLNPPSKTGDNLNLAMWVTLGVSSALLLFLLFGRRRKEEEQNG